MRYRKRGSTRDRTCELRCSLDAAECIAQLEAAVAVIGAQIAEQQARIAEQQARIAELERQVAALLDQVAMLTEQVAQNSRNSHMPPSSDPPGAGKANTRDKQRGKAKRKRGGQPGHKGHRHELLPESEVSEFVEHDPPRCESCWEPLPEVPDPRATRLPIVDVPPGGPARDRGPVPPGMDRRQVC
ncbi:MAG: hypothetical protein D6689_01685 [Deltaproteobacteria bacterium]|nr:MAG: hypothetical protein D6689_01685 [Deltaproteobacteria bacterium]